MNSRTATPGMSSQASADQIPHGFGVFLLELFKAAGVERVYKLTPYKNPGKKQLLGNLEVQRWQNGAYEIVSLFRQTEVRERSDKWAMVFFNQEFKTGPKHRYVYNIRKQVTVGKCFPGWYWINEVIPSRAAFYVVMPNKCPAPQLILPKVIRRGMIVKATVSIPGAAGLHALKLRARTPAGKPAEWLEQIILVGKDATEVYLPFAHNDPAGAWELTLTDVFTPETQQQIVINLR